MTPSQTTHIQIFKNLFKGRSDVHATYWESKTSNQKRGFSPACANKFKDACKLSSGSKCWDCTAQKFIPITDQVYDKHLSGRGLIGIYPLLQDKSCHFIAADFDNHKENPLKTPLQEAKAFCEVCAVQEVPCYLERSKSGNGFHAWIFFSSPVPEWKARRVARWALEEAQIIGDETADATSFDRLFPNQDLLSGKGLGNLIAPPLFGKAFVKGNSTFLDKDLKPITDDIWNFLESI